MELIFCFAFVSFALPCPAFQRFVIEEARQLKAEDARRKNEQRLQKEWLRKRREYEASIQDWRDYIAGVEEKKELLTEWALKIEHEVLAKVEKFGADVSRMSFRVVML